MVGSARGNGTGAGCSNAARSVRACCSLKTSDVQQRRKNNNNGTQLFVCRCRWEERPPSISQTRRATIPFPTLCYRPRCRKSPPTVSLSRCVLSSSPMLRFLPDFHHNLAQTPIPVRAQRSRRQAQIVPPPLRQAHPRSGTRQGQAPGAHYPNASAARHRLLFAASRTQERCRGVKQARQPLATDLWSREKRSVACCCLGD